MRLLPLLAVAFFASVTSGMKIVTHYKLPGPFLDGTVITFYFYHSGDQGRKNKERVDLDFRDDHKDDIAAHLRLERDWYKPVMSNSYVDRKWPADSEQRIEQPLDLFPAANGWWRVDVIKYDNYRLNVFFQEFWSDIRTFKKPLDNINQVFMETNFVSPDSIQIIFKPPNSNLPPKSFTSTTFKDSQYKSKDRLERKVLSTISSFPVGSIIDMVVALRASGGGKYDYPTLLFAPVDLPLSDFLQISQELGHKLGHRAIYGLTFTDTERMVVKSMDGKRDCLDESYEQSSGDLKHLRLTRFKENIVRVQVLYKPAPKMRHVIQCDHTVATELVDRAGGFNILSQQGAVIFHIEQRNSRAIVKQN